MQIPREAVCLLTASSSPDAQSSGCSTHAYPAPVALQTVAKAVRTCYLVASGSLLPGSIRQTGRDEKSSEDAKGSVYINVAGDVGCNLSHESPLTELCLFPEKSHVPQQVRCKKPMHFLDGSVAPILKRGVNQKRLRATVLEMEQHLYVCGGVRTHIMQPMHYSSLSLGTLWKA